MFKILERVKKIGDEAEILYVEGREYPVIFKANKFHTAQRKDFMGMGFRLVHRGKLGFSSTTKKEDYVTLFETARDASKFGERVRFVFPEKMKFKSIKTYFPSTLNIKNETINDYCENFISEILKEDKGAKVDMMYRRGERTVRIVNTKGLDVTYSRTFMSLLAQIFLIVNSSFVWIYKVKLSPKKTFFTKKDITGIIKKMRSVKKVASVDSGKSSVIFMPTVMPILLRSFTLGINGKTVQKGSSPLLGKIDKKILDERVTIYDDALMEKGVGSRPFDAEGVTSKRLHIFKNGILKNFIFDLQTAGIMGKKSTGSAVRDFDQLPTPGISNLVVSPGNWSVADMRKDIKDGIIVYSVLGGGQSNLLSGDFSFNIALGFKINNGKIVGRVKDTMIAGNVYHLMNNIAGIGKTVENIGSYYTPAFYFKSANVVG